jgi:putative heme iron utilization protein
MIGFSSSHDLSSVFILASRLAYHTQDILKDPRCSLMIAETDCGDREPQNLARVTLRGEATPVHEEDLEYDEARKLFLMKFPESEFLFELGDFSLYRITPRTGRFVAGVGKTFNISLEDLRRASSHMD